MAYDGFDVIKDLLGTVGPILAAVPWFLDYGVKRRRVRVKGAKTVGKLDDLREELVIGMGEELDTPRTGDFWWTVVGLGMISASFIVSLVKGYCS